jgi:MoxR-like ATPase
VLSFDALADGVTPESLVQKVVATVPVPVIAPLQEGAA